MTPAKLRAIAGRLEQVCIQTRKLLSGKTVACDECLADAKALRELAQAKDATQEMIFALRFTKTFLRNLEDGTRSIRGIPASVFASLHAVIASALDKAEDVAQQHGAEQPTTGPSNSSNPPQTDEANLLKTDCVGF